MKQTKSRVNMRSLLALLVIGGTVAFSVSSIDARRSRWSRNSARHKASCLSYCAKNKRCNHCSTNRGCGFKYTRMKSWTGYGRNWHACTKYGSINYRWDQEQGGIYSTTRTLVVTLGGFFSFKKSKHDGFEWFCEDYIKRTGYARRIKCISAYGMPTTSSNTLANNIKGMIHRIRSVSGRWPTVILVGKSMGGCKLSRALYEKSLRHYNIHTFIGVDMSCTPSKHFQKGEYRLYHRNVRNLFNFYQTIDGTQTGYWTVYADEYRSRGTWNPYIRRATNFYAPGSVWARQVNVNTENFDFRLKRKTGGNLCYRRDHSGDSRPIDQCPKLRNGVFYYIRKASGY